ncbi:MAG TPA: ATP-binding protein [Acidimicrobiales bacterium]|nr:ATP-binding protein [Acidimicrobiales bacterium]
MVSVPQPDPVPEGVDPVLHLAVRAGLHAPSIARAFIRCAVELLGASASEDVLLLTSEAVTNSVVHASTESVGVSLWRSEGHVHVSVTDNDPVEPQIQPDDPTRAGGFGVRLIDMLADDWGVARIGDDGKCVWFEVPVSGELAAVP